jgi:excisionase family DNA binding protein
MTKLISIGELARLTDTSECFWRGKIKRGELPAIRLGRRVRIASDVIDLIFASGGVSGRKSPKAVRPPHSKTVAEGAPVSEADAR